MATPRAVKDSDTALWLHNKLGSTEELWLSSSIGGIIKTDTIDNICRCFSVLTTTVKMKLLLGILHLPRRNLDEMKHTIEGIVELALEDVDQWVRLVANVVKTYPMRGKLDLDLSSNPIAAGVIAQLREKVNDSDVFSTLPLECKYVNKNALQSLVGNQPPPVRHFALKRKPKSAALRVDLMQRSSDASNQVKKDGSGFNKTVPVKHRDMTRKLSDASPMRGIPKTPVGHKPEGFRTQSTPSSHLTPGVASRTASRFSSRSERGTKLLDISEQPIGIREQKRRKKQQQEEEAAQQPQADEKVDETPEYAAGLPQTVSEPVAPDEELPGTSGTDKDSQNQPEDEEDDDEQDAEMEDEDYPSQYSPAESPTKTYDSIDQEESSAPPLQKETLTPQPVAAEKRPSVEELPVYAMPATPSPYFKPVTAPSIITASPTRSHPILSSPKTPSHSSSSSTSSSSPSPSRNPGQIFTVPAQNSAVSQNTNPLHQPRTNAHPAVIEHTTPKPPQMPQVPRFYSSPMQVQSGQTSLSSPVSQQSPTRQPVTVLRHPAMYHQQIQAGLRTAAPYTISPDVVRLQQLRAQNLQFAPGIGATAPPGGIQVASHRLFRPQINLQQQASSVSQAQQLAQAQQAAAQAQNQQTQMPKKTLTVTREQMIQAQEIFKIANRLTRQEKAIILGFMAGSRDNPAPDKGDVLQITLSEHEQYVQSANGPIPAVVETIFEMNYRTGTTAKKQRVKQLVAQYSA